MPRSSAPKAKVYGSQRLHPYAQKLPIEPASEPVHSKAAIHPVLRRSPRVTKNKYRSAMSALTVDGNYDPDTPIPSIESDPSPEPYFMFGGQIMQSPHSPEPSSRSTSIVSTTTEDSLVAANPGEQRSSSPEKSFRKRQELEIGDPIEYMVFDILGGDNNRDVMEELEYCRICFDQDANLLDRFVTDCVQTSGRVYDRLSHCEIKRIIPWVGDYVSRNPHPRVYDVLTGEVRRRLLYDDFRDCNARIRGHLAATKDEWQMRYDEIRFP